MKGNNKCQILNLYIQIIYYFIYNTYIDITNITSPSQKQKIPYNISL